MEYTPINPAPIFSVGLQVIYQQTFIHFSQIHMFSISVRLLPLLVLAACSSPPTPSPAQLFSPNTAAVSAQGVKFIPVPVTHLPDWPPRQLNQTAQALEQSCRIIGKKDEWLGPCQELSRLNTLDQASIQRFFETHFLAWQITAGQRNRGLITGYYEPLLKGCRTREPDCLYPIYGVPPDLVSFNIPKRERTTKVLLARQVAPNRLVLDEGQSLPGARFQVNFDDFPPQSSTLLKGRIENDRFVPYYTRADIAEGKGVINAPILAWASDAVDLFFLQIQGSGRILLDDGMVLRVGVADNNGYHYQSIGRWLIDQGYLSKSSASAQRIRAWLEANPTQQQALFNVNPRYIFFKASPDDSKTPIGSLGAPLTEGYSLAVDPHFIPLGAPIYLATSWPMTQNPLNRLMVAQDTGNAIRGPLRADFFWGYGEQADSYAGRMKQDGRLWILLPNGLTPN